MAGERVNLWTSYPPFHAQMISQTAIFLQIPWSKELGATSPFSLPPSGKLLRGNIRRYTVFCHFGTDNSGMHARQG
jgi:hypothetical protein